MTASVITILIFMSSFQTLFCALFEKKYQGRSDLSSPVFCIIEGIAVPVFSLIWMMFDIRLTPDSFSMNFIGLNFNISTFGVILGILNAIALFGYNTYLIKASAKGSYAFLNVMMLFGGIIVPVFYTSIFHNETVYPHQFLAIFLMLFSFVLMNYKDIRLKGTPWIYYVYCFILFLTNGAYGTFLKIQSFHNESELNEMIIVTYAVMGLFAFVQLLLKEKKTCIEAFKIGKSAIFPLVLCIFTVALAINVNALIIPLVDTAILYTIDNGGVLVLSALYSMLFFKEKPQLLKILGIIVAVISIIILSVPLEILKNLFNF